MNQPSPYEPPISALSQSGTSKAGRAFRYRACVGVAFAVLPYPFVAYYLLLTFFFGAAILSRFGPVEARSFWRWFAFSGWLYVLLGVSLIEAIESTTLWDTTRTWLQRNSPIRQNWNPEHYLIFVHSLIAIGVAISGAVLIPKLSQALRLRHASNQSVSALKTLPKSKP